MRMIVSLPCMIGLALWLAVASPTAAADSSQGESAHADSSLKVQVYPDVIRLSGPYDRVQVVVTAVDAQGQPSASSADLTTVASFQIISASADNQAEIPAGVDASGLITAFHPGSAVLSVSLEGLPEPIKVPVEVSLDSASTTGKWHPTEVDFLKDVRPVFAKAGCAMAACHAAQHGQGGFKLSVFGYDPGSDYEQIAQYARGRRINPARPDGSLILQKAAARTAHVGGLRISPQSLEYQIVRQWIAQGSGQPRQPELKVDRLDVYPAMRIATPQTSQQLRVVAHFNDGSQRDVSALALYDAIDSSVINVTSRGLVSTYSPGQTAVMVRYEGQVATSTFVVPFADQTPPEQWVSQNFVDELVAEKFTDLGLKPSPLCDDATFIRRAFLDAIGSLPQATEVEAFLKSPDPKKRENLVDRLLGLTGDPAQDIYNDRYAAFWTLRWSDLIRNNSNSLGAQGMWAMHNWIRQAFRENRPYDRIVYDLVTAKGSIYSNGPANYFRVHGDSSALTEATSMLFLGMRLECAKCHQHPFESISQSDYYSMAAFFSRVASKTSEDFGLFGRETVIMTRPTGEVSHPKTGKRLPPKPLGSAMEMDDPLDRRLPLARWLTSADNQMFAQAVVNRYISFLLGTGLVEPVDDMRSTNPPSNKKLIDALAADFVEHQFDLKQLMRVIMTSRVYGLSSTPTESNANDQRFYSHFNVKRLSAEVLLDAIDQATGSPTKFKDLPAGTRAIELPDAEYPDYFLNTFAKPRRVSVCQCERAPDANLAQALHTLNGDIITTKIAAKNGRIARLMDAQTTHEAIVNELYLAALCRYPSQAEMDATQEIVQQSPTPTEAYQDLLWALINSKQFLFVR